MFIRSISKAALGLVAFAGMSLADDVRFFWQPVPTAVSSRPLNLPNRRPNVLHGVQVLSPDTVGANVVVITLEFSMHGQQGVMTKTVGLPDKLEVPSDVYDPSGTVAGAEFDFDTNAFMATVQSITVTVRRGLITSSKTVESPVQGQTY